MEYTLKFKGELDFIRKAELLKRFYHVEYMTNKAFMEANNIPHEIIDLRETKFISIDMSSITAEENAAIKEHFDRTPSFEERIKQVLGND